MRKRLGKRKLSKFIPLLLLGLIIFLSFSIFLTFRSNLFIIKTVNVSLEKVDCTTPEQLKNSSGILGQNLIFLDSSKITGNIKNQFICIKDIQLSKQLLNKVNLFATGRQALGKLISLNTVESTMSASLADIATPSAQVNSESFLVDKDGVVFSKDFGQVDVPSIFIDNKDLSLGTKLDESIHSSLKVLERVKIFNLSFQAAEILNNILIIYPQIDNPKVIFRLDGEIDAQLASLQLILEKAKIDSTSIDASSLQFIDLRFDKPVVKIAPKK